MANEIVVGYDGSECADVALAEAIRIAGKFDTAVIVVYAAHVPAALAGGAGDQRRILEARGEELIAIASERAAAAGVSCIPRISNERPVDALVTISDEVQAEMIVVGTYSDRPLAAAIVGSTPPKLLYMSNRPVLVVPVPD